MVSLISKVWVTGEPTLKGVMSTWTTGMEVGVAWFPNGRWDTVSRMWMSVCWGGKDHWCSTHAYRRQVSKLRCSSSRESPQWGMGSLVQFYSTNIYQTLTMCQDPWDALENKRGIKNKFCCQSSHNLVPTPIIDSGWGSLVVGWTKFYKNTQKRGFNINWWVAGCWEDTSKGLQDFDSQSFRRILLEELNQGKLPIREWHRQRHKGVSWLSMGDAGQGKTLVTFWQRATCSYQFPNLGRGYGMQILRWQPMISDLV